MGNNARIVHSKTARATTGTDAQRVYGADWNADHVLTGLENVDNTADADKPISSATQTALNAALPKAGGTMTGAINVAPTGFFYQPDGAIVHRLADRVFMGDAVANSATSVAADADWLTTFQISTGRANGFILTSQTAILNTDHINSANTLTVAAQNANVSFGAIGLTSIGVNNNTTDSGSGALAAYFEAYRMPGALAGAGGLEIDTINAASAAPINPFAQVNHQTIGLQLAGGGDLPLLTQFPASAAINIQYNGATFQTGIVFGANAIEGTDGTSGQGEAVAFATGHVVNYYYASNVLSWQFYAGFGVNGDFIFNRAGTGSVNVPSLKTPEVKFPATQVPSSDPNTLDDYQENTFVPFITLGGLTTGITYTKQAGLSTKVGNRVDFSLEIILSSKGTSTGSLIVNGLPFTATATLSTAVVSRCGNMATSISTPPMGLIIAGTTTANLATIISGAGTALLDTDLTNTSTIRLSGHYFVDS